MLFTPNLPSLCAFLPCVTNLLWWHWCSVCLCVRMWVCVVIFYVCSCLFWSGRPYEALLWACQMERWVKSALCATKGNMLTDHFQHYVVEFNFRQWAHTLTGAIWSTHYLRYILVLQISESSNLVNEWAAHKLIGSTLCMYKANWIQCWQQRPANPMKVAQWSVEVKMSWLPRSKMTWVRGCSAAWFRPWCNRVFAAHPIQRSTNLSGDKLI